MSPKLRNFMLTMLLFLSSLISFGQEKGGPPPPPNRTIDPPSGLVVPIDESLICLLIAGLFLGLYFFLKSKSEGVN